jgi:DNA-directed RNA polymerase subunit RPC12/RpoP
MSQNIERKCLKCGSNMVISDLESINKSKVDDDIIFNNKKDLYICQSCGEKVELTSLIYIFFNFLTGLFALVILTWFIIDFDLFLNWFSLGFFGWLMGVFIFIIMLILVSGGFMNLKHSINDFVYNNNYPIIYTKSLFLSSFGIFFFSATPIIIIIAFGFFDEFVNDIPEEFGYFLLPIAFSPWFLGVKKFNMDLLALFWGTVFWMAILILCIFNCKI